MLNGVLVFFGNANDDSRVLVELMADVMKKNGKQGSIQDTQAIQVCKSF